MLALVEGGVLAAHRVLDDARERPLDALALERGERLLQQLDGVQVEAAALAAARGGAPGGLGGEAVVEDELVAVGDQQLAGRLAVADADDALVELAQLAHERREVAVAGDDDEGVDVLAAVGELHGVDRHLDVGAVLGALARGGHLDEPEARVHQLVAGVAVPAPVRVGALHDHAALLGQAVQHQVDIEVGSSLGPGSGHVLEVDQHGERALALGQWVLQISCGAAGAAASHAAKCRVPRVRRTDECYQPGRESPEFGGPERRRH